MFAAQLEATRVARTWRRVQTEGLGLPSARAGVGVSGRGGSTVAAGIDCDTRPAAATNPCAMSQ